MLGIVIVVCLSSEHRVLHPTDTGTVSKADIIQEIKTQKNSVVERKSPRQDIVQTTVEEIIHT